MSVVQFVVDEAASLGQFKPIADMIAIGRGYGIRLVLIYQSLGQLKLCFPEGQDQTLLGNVSSIFFAVNDNATAEYVSTRLGEGTIIVESGGTSSGGSHQWTQSGQPSSSRTNSYNRSESWQQMARKLLKPEEIMALPPRTAITFAPNVPPVCSTLLRWYEEPWLGRKSGWLAKTVAACLTLMASLAFAATAMLSAAALTEAVSERGAQQYVIPLEMNARPERIYR